MRGKVVLSLWLVDYEFSDTILLITKSKVVFAVSAKKRKCHFGGNLIFQQTAISGSSNIEK